MLKTEIKELRGDWNLKIHFAVILISSWSEGSVHTLFLSLSIIRLIFCIFFPHRLRILESSTWDVCEDQSHTVGDIQGVVDV